MKKILSLFRDPLWNFLWGLIIALGYFRINAEDVMSIPWYDMFKLSLMIGVPLFVVHAYYSVKLQVKRLDNKTNATIDLLPGLHNRLWVLDSNLNRCLAYIHKDNPDVSSLLWLRTADGFNKISQTHFVKDALKEALVSFRTARLLTSDDLNEIHDILQNFDPDRYKFEIESINSEIKRISNS